MPKISDLPAATTIQATDVFPFNAVGTTSKITWSNLQLQLDFQPQSDALDDYSAIPPTELGLRLCSFSLPVVTNSYVKISTAGIPSYDSPAQMVSRIGAEPHTAGLTTLSTLTPTSLGQNMLTLDNATVPCYPKFINGLENSILKLTPAQVAADLRATLISPDTTTTTSDTGITPNVNTTQLYKVTALTQNLVINAPTGTPGSGQRLMFRFLDAGVSKTLTWNAIYIGTKPSATTAGKTHYVEFIYNSTVPTWDLLNAVVMP